MWQEWNSKRVSVKLVTLRDFISKPVRDLEFLSHALTSEFLLLWFSVVSSGKKIAHVLRPSAWFNFVSHLFPSIFSATWSQSLVEIYWFRRENRNQSTQSSLLTTRDKDLNFRTQRKSSQRRPFNTYVIFITVTRLSSYNSQKVFHQFLQFFFGLIIKDKQPPDAYHLVTKSVVKKKTPHHISKDSSDCCQFVK